jgi:hypothetical protein
MRVVYETIKSRTLMLSAIDLWSETWVNLRDFVPLYNIDNILREKYSAW